MTTRTVTKARNANGKKQADTMKKPPITQQTATPSGSLPDPLPTSEAPTPPRSFVQGKGGIPLGNPPKLSQVASAEAVAGELTAESTEYQAALGSKAPSPAAFSSALVVAAGWSAQRAAAAAWFDYCRTEEAKAWRPVMATTAKIRPILAGVTAVDPSVATSLPELTAFVNAAVVAGRKAAASRKAGTNATKKKVAKAAATVARAAAKAHPNSTGTANGSGPSTPPPPTPAGGAVH